MPVAGSDLFGLSLGVAMSMGLGQLLSKLLFVVSPFDPIAVIRQD